MFFFLNRFLVYLLAFFLSVASFIACATTDKVEIYTASYCSECQRAKTYLRDKGIAFIEYDVEKDRAHLREFYARGGRGIPYLFVNGRAMHGFDVERFGRLRAGQD